MRRGRYWRVGHTAMFNSRGFGMTVRMSTEAGEEAWALAMLDSRTEASVLEQIIHCKYGIPTTHWEQCNSFDPEVHRTDEQIEKIYDGIGFGKIAEEALRLLSDYCRDPRYPFVTAGEEGAFSRRKTRVVRACNLVAGMMQVPVPTEGPNFDWRTIEDVGVEPYVGPVYSMDVEKDQHYIADGIVSHNCWYAVKKTGKGHWAGDRKQTTLWQISGKDQDAKTVHGTQKPVECMRRPILNNSSPGQAVYEPFMGSGTTLIAAETTGRVCLGIELNPAYVDVAVQRWQTFTGQDAVLDGTDQSFADTRAAPR